MKNDINLLFKRKVKKHVGKKMFAALLGAAVLAGGLYAGITLPAQSLEAERKEVAKLDEQLNASTETGDILLEKLDNISFLDEQLEGLKRLNIEKSDVSDYIDIVENSLPAGANITQLSLVSDTMNITGIADNDTIIAMFCLRLRETNIFEEVFIYNTAADLENEQISTFMLSATLPTSLSTSTVRLIDDENEIIDGQITQEESQ